MELNGGRVRSRRRQEAHAIWSSSVALSKSGASVSSLLQWGPHVAGTAPSTTGHSNETAEWEDFINSKCPNPGRMDARPAVCSTELRSHGPIPGPPRPLSLKMTRTDLVGRSKSSFFIKHLLFFL